ncbi:MAG: helix-turn-helix transcriptional regulator [Ruminococcaceae bacterium]|nr:helix-turn-helix transcriptional regulator [Oscillospiraceae bacterium]
MDEEIRLFCRNVKLLRERYDLTLAEMAERLGVSEKEVMMLEQGVIPEETTVEIVMRIDKCFGISPKAQFEP